MLIEYLHYGLLVALAIALVTAAFTDLKRRQIDNWLNIGIALGAPLFWWTSGLAFWPDVAWQVGIALITFAITAGMFALRWMGGGDVKLLSVLALWIAPAVFFELIVIMALLGGLLTVVFATWHFMHGQKDRIAIPYGVAISAAGLWVLSSQYFPQAGLALSQAGVTG